jgi:hypothetical protein
MGKPLLGRSKQIGALRKRMAEQLYVDSAFVDLTPELKKKLKEASQYNDFRRIENERQLECIKSVLGEFIFDENITVGGDIPDGKGGTRHVELSRFDVLMKAVGVFLSAMNMQNKMWGLYTEVKLPTSGPKPIEPTVVFSKIVAEMQRIAKKPIPALPAHDARAVNNGPQNPDP